MTLPSDADREHLARERLELALDLLGLIPFTTDEAHVRLVSAMREVRAAADILAGLDPSPAAQLDRQLDVMAALARPDDQKDSRASVDPTDDKLREHDR
jgi:hypothetical protein